MAAQIKHRRTSKRGKTFVAGKDKPPKLPPQLQKQIIKENAKEITKTLKSKKRAKIPHLGILKLKFKPAQKGGKKITAFGKTFISKPKPRHTVIKFSASKELKDMII